MAVYQTPSGIMRRPPKKRPYSYQQQGPTYTYLSQPIQQEEQDDQQQDPMQAYDMYKKYAQQQPESSNFNDWLNSTLGQQSPTPTSYNPNSYPTWQGAGEPGLTPASYGATAPAYSTQAGYSTWAGAGEPGFTPASYTAEAAPAGEGAGAVAGYVLAAILGQMVASHNTEGEFEGQPAGNWFSGVKQKDDNKGHYSIGTEGWAPMEEPWLEWLHGELGWEPTIGRKWDAALANEDYGTMAKRTPAAADYWADPIRSWLGYDTWKNILGEDLEWLAYLADPIQGILQKFEDWF